MKTEKIKTEITKKFGVKKQGMVRNLIIFAFLFIENANAAGASASHHEAPGISSLIWPAINFAIYFYILSRAYKKFAVPALVGKEATIRKEIESNKSELLNANSNLESVKKREEHFKKW